MPEPTTQQLKSEIKELQSKVDALRELGDALWYCLRHRHIITKSEIEEAVEEWMEYR